MYGFLVCPITLSKGAVEPNQAPWAGQVHRMKQIHLYGGQTFMSTYHTGPQSTVIYQADPAVIQHLHGVRESLHQSCKPYLNHQVKVQTIDGQMHEGTIAGMDSKHLYLTVTITTDMGRGYYNPYYKPYPGPGYPGPGYPYPGQVNNNVILPLVLFELLAISLI